VARQKPSKNVRHKQGPLDEVDGRILALMMSDPGITQAEIAERINYSPEVVNRRIKRPEFQARLEKETEAITAEVVKIVKRMQLKAALRASRLVDSTDEQVAARVALKVLDGIPEVAAGTMKQATDTPGENMSDDERKAVARYLAESEGEEAEE
jgi:DNA-binding Lrp family transcriptional regulator